MADWYRDWQHPAHAVHFDGRAGLRPWELVRELESFNDIRLLTSRLHAASAWTLVEVGCATGELFRYLRIRYPKMRYAGFDISEPAISRARAKYPQGHFVACQPGVPLAQTLQDSGLLRGAAACIYAKDVVHHQPHPFEFMEDLLVNATEGVVMRLRTRDVGPTELDPERSCQYHYDGWMPYMVMNLQEMVDRIHRMVPRSELIVLRHHLILGGRLNRFLPKDCYLPQTGTAETAVGVFLDTDRPGHVTITDQEDGRPATHLLSRVRGLAGGAAGRRVQGAP